MSSPALEVGKLAVREDTRREYVPRGQGEAEGWIRIGRYDSCRRRALWARFVNFDDYTYPVTCDAIELCAGREGDDALVRIEKDNPAFEDMLDVILRAADHIPARWAKYDREEHARRVDSTPTGSTEGDAK